MKPWTRHWVFSGLVGWSLFVTFAQAEGVASSRPASAPAGVETEKLPITEVTVFKDGHAFVLREGTVPVDESGTVVLDDLPAPVLGTFWPYAAEKGVTLQQVVAGKRELNAPRPAMNIRDLLDANVGAAVQVCEVDGKDYDAIIVGIPEAKPAGDRSPAGTGPLLASAQPAPRPEEQASVVLLQVHEQTKVVPIDRIRDLSFRQTPKQAVDKKENRGVLTLHLQSIKAWRLERTQVGMVYLQKGLRWIPNYKVDIDGKGNATVKLQATLINELADLKDTKVQLVVGVPSFAFKGNLDPMSLQESAAQLGQHFQQQSQTAFAFSNAIMSQTAVFEPQSASPAPSGPSLGPDMPEGTKAEDLFIFTISGVTLAKGERAVVPVAEFTVPYKDVYVLDLPSAPPAEIVQSLRDSQQNRQGARLMLEPKVMHKLRLTNKTQYPFTTAPALIVQKGRALGQGMMTYTAVGGASDLDLTVAVDVRGKKTDVETERVPNALSWHNVSLAKISLKGTITISNSRGEPVDVEVVRHVLGQADSADQDGTMEQTNTREDAWELDLLPEWFRWYNWPGWWQHVNGIGRIRWDVHLEAGEKKELTYSWHYFWS